MYKLSFALVVLAVAQLANGQRILSGKCAEPTYLKTFDAESYMGKWFEWAHYSHVFELAQKCSTAQYTLTKNGTVDVVNTAISTVTGKPTSIEGYAIVLGPGILNVRFPMGAVLPQNDDANYIVVATDYTKYSVVQACRNLLGTHLQFAWVLTRDANPSDETVEKIKEALEANKIPLKHLRMTDQLNCPVSSE